MSKREEQRAQALEKITAHMLKTGLGQTSLRQLAAVAGTSDRMLLYYFADKNDVIVSALTLLAGSLTERLEDGFPEGTRLPAAELFAKATALTRGPEVRPFMSLWLEIVAAAGRGEEPYRSVAEAISAGFIAWIEARLAPAEGQDGHATALMLFSMIDGLELLEAVSGKRAADAAVERMVLGLKG